MINLLNMELNTILNLLISYNLTFDEFYLIYLTFLARDEENHPEYFVKWFSNGGKGRLKDLFNSLKEKGIIHKNYNPEVYNPNDIEFNKNYFENIKAHINEIDIVYLASQINEEERTKIYDLLIRNEKKMFLNTIFV